MEAAQREAEQNHIARGGTGEQGSSGDRGPIVAEEFARLLEKLKEGLRTPEPGGEGGNEEIPITSQPSHDDDDALSKSGVDALGRKYGTGELSQGGQKFTFESNSDEQIKITIKSDNDEPVSDDSSLHTNLSGDNADEFGNDDETKSSYRMPTF
jgi:hypothetical protein